jgi:hypothetical protein
MTMPFSDERADWVKVLETMYENQMTLDSEPTKNNDGLAGLGISFGNIIQGGSRVDRLTTETDISEENVIDIIDYLEDVNLVQKYTTEIEESTSGTISMTRTKEELVNFGLTREGLQLAHQIKTEQQRQTTNRRLLYLTGILVLLTLALVVNPIL